MKKQSRRGFTLMELMIVVVLIAIIAGFAMPSYIKSLRKAHERDAVLQLSALHAANLIYKAGAGTFLVGDNLNTKAINQALGINIVENEMTYRYSSNGVTFNATGTSSDNDNPFTVLVDERPLDKDVNPCCDSSGNNRCPSLPGCSNS